MRVTLSTAVLAFAAGAAHAELPDIAPGLWEQSMSVKSENGELERAMAEMQRQMANAPPAQLEMMEQMLAEQGLASLDRTFTHCVTPEEARRGILEVMETEDGCTQAVTERTGNTVAFDYACSGESSEQGQGEITFHSSRHYSGSFELETEIEGRPERLYISHEGKWRQANCGDAGR